MVLSWQSLLSQVGDNGIMLLPRVSAKCRRFAYRAFRARRHIWSPKAHCTNVNAIAECIHGHPIWPIIRLTPNTLVARRTEARCLPRHVFSIGRDPLGSLVRTKTYQGDRRSEGRPRNVRRSNTSNKMLEDVVATAELQHTRYPTMVPSQFDVQIRACRRLEELLCRRRTSTSANHQSPPKRKNETHTTNHDTAPADTFRPDVLSTHDENGNDDLSKHDQTNPGATPAPTPTSSIRSTTT